MAKRDSARTTAWVATTYFGEGLPWSFIHQMGTQFLTAIKAPAEQVGYTSLLHFAVTLKFLWSPLVDLFGRKRTWLWIMQLVLSAGMLGVAAVSASGSLPLFWTALILLAVLHATHDIACDGFYMVALDRRSQALYSGVRMAAFRGAMILGSGPLVMLAGRSSWPLAFAAAAAAMGVVALVNALLMPRPDEPRAKVVKERESEERPAPFARVAYRTFFTQPKAAVVLAFIFFHKIGDVMMFAMSPPLQRDIGVDTWHRGALSTMGLLVFIISTIGGGGVIARLGLARCLVPMTFFQNLAIPLYAVMATVKPGFASIVAIVATEQMASGIGEAAKAVFLLQRCRAAFSASHFAFATAVVALSSTLFGSLSGHLYAAVSAPSYFTIAFVASLPSLVLVFFVPRTPIEPGS